MFGITVCMLAQSSATFGWQVINRGIGVVGLLLHQFYGAIWGVIVLFALPGWIIDDKAKRILVRCIWFLVGLFEMGGCTIFFGWADLLWESLIMWIPGLVSLIVLVLLDIKEEQKVFKILFVSFQAVLVTVAVVQRIYSAKWGNGSLYVLIGFIGSYFVAFYSNTMYLRKIN